MPVVRNIRLPDTKYRLQLLTVHGKVASALKTGQGGYTAPVYSRFIIGRYDRCKHFLVHGWSLGLS